MNVVLLAAVIFVILFAGAVTWAFPHYRRIRIANAIWESDVEYVGRALVRGFPVNTPVPYGSNALSIALLVEPKTGEDRRPYEMVQQLLDAGADPNQQSETNAPSLFLAITEGNATMVRLLLAEGARVDVPWGKGATPRHWALLQLQCDLACPASRQEVVRVLLDAGASVHASINRRPSALALVDQWEEHEQKAQLEEGRSAWARRLETLERHGIQMPGVSDENRALLLAAHQAVVREVTTLVRMAGAQAP